MGRRLSLQATHIDFAEGFDGLDRELVWLGNARGRLLRPLQGRGIDGRDGKRCKIRGRAASLSPAQRREGIVNNAVGKFAGEIGAVFAVTY